MECLGLHNKPKAEVHLGHKLTGPKEEEEDICLLYCIVFIYFVCNVFFLTSFMSNCCMTEFVDLRNDMCVWCIYMERKKKYVQDLRG
jgi:hypothetical protein